MSSLSGFVLDILFYALFIRLLENVFPNYYIVVSTYLSRIILSIYVFIVNKKIVFRNNGKVIPTAMRFFILCICQATVSGFSVRLLVGLLGGGKIVLKLVVDTLLFFVSYRIQDDWVFKNDYSEQKLMK
jgi:putative flippase GtrA